MAARRPPKAQVPWSQVKAKLSDFDRAGLITLLHDLYAASKETQAFLRSRFGLGGDPLEPFLVRLGYSVTYGASVTLPIRIRLDRVWTPKHPRGAART